MGTSGVLAVAAIVGLLAALVAYRRAQTTARDAETARRQLALAANENAHEADELRAQLAEAQAGSAAAAEEAEGLRRERDELKESLERSRSARWLESRWNEQLRERLAELHRERGLLGDTSDVRALVLRLAINLLGAEKGLLISRLDEDNDGDLDLVCADGFEHDPEGSAVAQYFASEVIDRDRTVRAEHPAELPLERRTPADEEIENLCAIPIYLHDRFAGVVVCVNKPGGFTEYDDDVLLALGDHAGAVLLNGSLRGRLRQSYVTTIQVLTEAIEAKDRELRGHSTEVADYVHTVAKRLGLEPQRLEQLLFASLLHDIGKLGISDTVLLKPGPLSPSERALVEQHPRIGYRLVEQIPELRDIAPAVLHHHERWDGEGYPAKLRGDEIPLEARLISVADAFSSMISDRPYRTALSVEDACEELRRCAGTQFDADVVRLFVDEVSRAVPSEASDALTRAMEDPELAARLGDDEHVLGAGVSTADAIPRLYNHAHLHRTAAAEATRADLQGRPFAVIAMHAPGLRDVNESAGYDAGDELLRIVAESAERLARRCGGTAGRESGSRICVVVPGADERVAEHLADELAAELGERDGAARLEVRVAAWRTGDSGDDVIRRARSGDVLARAG